MLEGTVSNPEAALCSVAMAIICSAAAAIILQALLPTDDWQATVPTERLPRARLWDSAALPRQAPHATQRTRSVTQQVQYRMNMMQMVQRAQQETQPRTMSLT